MTIAPDPKRRKQAEALLRAVRVDEHGTPDRKLPNCPGCDNDELWAWRRGPGRYGFSCYLCLYKLELFNDGDKPTGRGVTLQFEGDEVALLAGIVDALAHNEHPVAIGHTKVVLERVALKLKAHKPVKEGA